MALRPKHRREIRDLLRVLYDDKAWQPRHTDSLLGIVRAARADVAEDIEKHVAADYAAHKRDHLALQRRQVEAVRDVEKFRDSLKDQHAKIALVLEALVDLPMAKALIVDPETGEAKLDHALISDKDAKVALSAIEKVLKVTGAMAPPKVEVEFSGGNAFEYLGEIEAEEVAE